MNEFRIIAHRGASMRASENTLAAFAAAVELGALCPRDKAEARRTVEAMKQAGCCGITVDEPGLPPAV